MGKLVSLKRSIYTTVEFEDEDELVTTNDSTFKPTRKSRTKVSLGRIKHHEPVELTFCGTRKDE